MLDLCATLYKILIKSNCMKFNLIAFIFSLSLLIIAGCRDQLGIKSDRKDTGVCYYVSPSGNDKNPGSETKQWKTIAKINSINFHPSDTVLFEGGAVFPGTIYLDSLD